MTAEPGPAVCDVVGCDRPATDNVVHVEASHVMGFRICEVHRRRTQEGQRPMVAAERSDLAQRFGRPALIMTVAWHDQADADSQTPGSPSPSQGPVEPTPGQA